MRFPLATLGVLLLVPVVAGHGGHMDVPAPHSQNVYDFYTTPLEPKRGEAVDAVVALKSNASVTDVYLRVCRVQAYSCRAPILMEAGGSPDVYDRTQYKPYHAVASWDAGFYRDVTQVGMAVIIHYANGTEEESPRESFPSHPAELPADAGRYYFYSLPPPPANSPAAGLVVAIIAFGLAVAWSRRR